MAIREWPIESPIRRDVRLEHGFVSGRVKLFVDEQLVFERPMTILDFGFRHQFSIDDTTHIVVCRPRGVGFSYSLDQIELAEWGIKGVFFNRSGFRRQMGCVTLMMALGFMGGWISALQEVYSASPAKTDYEVASTSIPYMILIWPLTLLSAYLWLSKAPTRNEP